MSVFQLGRRSSQGQRIAVIGATGFIGSATLRALAARGAAVTAIARQPPAQPDAAKRWTQADITDVDTLTTALEGVDVVIHAGSYTGSDPNLCEVINHQGTRNVLLAADRSGIESVITLSTIGVYGPGPFTGIVEDKREPNPITALSASRVAADHDVRAQGGTVVRPGFIHGPGDRWFTPGLWYILSQLGGWIDHGAPTQSTIEVDLLASQLADLALTPTVGDRGALFHASAPEPSSVRSIAAATVGQGRDLPANNLTFPKALRRAPDLGLTPRHIDLGGRDHTIDGTRLRKRLRGNAHEGSDPNSG
ncbi:NAD-dependent epimerase/dehydratase family protein [Rhodococcus tukisamuensis]|uniref:Nucleoside-diphosphate-sugar epimerase n=1 Tax=Rhodococcus tukisamuensis TaxID=168276 RepID=A0A1G6T7U5_9NOCA|nr:NAD(P)-dependent oxidoreductase [Rhodococcus tukisamuensis]SDD24944.1 Nucleoside-diphosphate-sugar epimerase [Rhodococcus tukisamuensis]